MYGITRKFNTVFIYDENFIPFPVQCISKILSEFFCEANVKNVILLFCLVSVLLTYFSEF